MSKQNKIRMPASEGGLLGYHSDVVTSKIVLSPWTIVGICAGMIILLIALPLIL